MSRIPPQAARLVGAWPGTGAAYHPRQPRPTRQRRTSRSTWVARLLHPLQHPVQQLASDRRLEAPSPATQPARPA